MISISSNLNLMIKAAEKASKSVIRDFGEVEKLQVSKKGPYDFVTKTDKNVEKILIEELSKSKKNYSFISEETGKINNKDKEKFWIIDPIDGTKAFISGIPTWGILLSLVRNNEPIIGVIYQPFTGEIFWGGFGQSFKQLGVMRGNPQSLSVRKCENISDAVVATSSPVILNKRFQTGLDKIMNIAKLERYGIDCYAYAMLADGSIDAVIEFGLQEYDIRAPEAIVLSAGGLVSNLDGSYPLTGGDVIASGDPRVHDQLIKVFNS